MLCMSLGLVVSMWPLQISQNLALEPCAKTAPPPTRLSVQCPGRHNRHRQTSTLSADITVPVCGYSESGTKTRFYTPGILGILEY